MFIEDLDDTLSSISVKIDSKGRIIIPSEIRRSFGIEEGDEIEFCFSIKKNLITLRGGSNGE